MTRADGRPDAARLNKLQQRVLQFYRSQRRDLPWRHTTDPYRIFVSEIMLQQTQVDRVIPKYREFLTRFPTVRSLARARFADVLRVWMGLGYNRRALALWQCARSIVRDGGRFPPVASELRLLPGIGPYTAAAISCFAFGARMPVIDTNVRRVLLRVLLGTDRALPASLSQLAQDALPPTHADQWAQGLMDIGARFCRSKPRCSSCPAVSMCAYVENGRPAPPARIGSAQGRFAGSSRFYRGRIMHALTVQSGGLSIAALRRQVMVKFGVSDAAWLDDLLKSLSRDGLVRLDSRRRRVSLP